MNPSKQHVKKITALLDEAYGTDDRCYLHYGKDYELLIAVILSAQCTDARVNLVTPALFRAFPTLESFQEAEEKEIETLIHSVGFFREKAKNIKAAMTRILMCYGGRVPDTMEDLLTLPGVGRKTANVVLYNAFGIPAFAVDTHVFRVTNRIGLCRAETVEETERQMTRLIPRGKWGNAHHWLIWHGRRVCKAQRPLCEECGLKDICESARKSL